MIFCQSLFFGSVVTSSELKVFRAVLYLSDESYADVCLILLLLLLFLESPRSFFQFCLLGGVFLLELDPDFVC